MEPIVIDFSSLVKGLAATGVFLLNMFVYEIVAFSVMLALVMPIMNAAKNDKGEERAVKGGFVSFLVAMAVLIVLYVTNTFRLIRL